MKERLVKIKKPSTEALVRLLEDDLERLRGELSEELERERQTTLTLKLRVKRLESLMNFLIQMAVMSIGFAAVYWGMHFFNQGEVWTVVTIAMGVGLFVLLLREANGNKKLIVEREAKEESTVD